MESLARADTRDDCPLFLSAAVNLDPNTHAVVLGTAFLTSVAFAVSAMNVLAVILSHVLN